MGEDTVRAEVAALREQLAAQGSELTRVLVVVERIEAALFRGNGRPALLERVRTVEIKLEGRPAASAAKGSSLAIKLDSVGLRRFAIGLLWVVGAVAALAALSGQDGLDLLRSLGLP